MKRTGQVEVMTDGIYLCKHTEDSRRLARGHVDVGRPKRRESPHVNYLLKRREPAHVVAGRLIVSSGLALT